MGKGDRDNEACRSGQKGSKATGDIGEASGPPTMGDNVLLRPRVCTVGRGHIFTVCHCCDTIWECKKAPVLFPASLTKALPLKQTS